MLRYLFLLIIVVHGLIHLIGFVNAWKIYSMKAFSGTTLVALSQTSIQIAGFLWMLSCLLFIGTGIAYGTHKEWWWLLGIVSVFLSQALIVLYWTDAKAGTVANATILVVACIAMASWRFTERVNAEVDTLLHAAPLQKGTIEENQLAGLPVPVQQWLKRSGVIGKPTIQTVRLKQEGLMRIKPEQKGWIEAKADQYITVEKPAYIWKVKMNMMPLLPVSGRDLFIDGHGRMNIKLFSLVDIVDAADEKIDQGSLQRWLAEMCWFPSAALSPYIKWESNDALSAEASMTYQGVSGNVTFFFSPNGDLVRCEANRYMGGGEEATMQRWSVVCKTYGSFEGIRMPIESEATWKLTSGDFTWYKLKITEVEFNKATRY